MVKRLSLKSVQTPWYFATAFVAVMGAPLPAAAQQSTQIEESYAVALIRDALLAVNHANLTGNYTTLRDYAAQSFHDANTATDLALLLQRVRSEQLDLLPVLSVQPVLEQSVLSLDQRIMRLSGYFPLEPRSITFDIEFAKENNRWLIYGLAVGAMAAPEADPETVTQTD